MAEGKEGSPEKRSEQKKWKFRWRDDEIAGGAGGGQEDRHTNSTYG